MCWRKCCKIRTDRFSGGNDRCILVDFAPAPIRCMVAKGV